MAWLIFFIAAFCALTNAPNLNHAPRPRLARMQCHAFGAAYFVLSNHCSFMMSANTTPLIKLHTTDISPVQILKVPCRLRLETISIKDQTIAP